MFNNAGGTRGLAAVGSFPTGVGPRSILSADLNNDHFDDLILLDTGTRGVDEVSIYLNQGNGTFQGIVPQRYVVGVNTVAMTTGDFNNDGKLDIAVVNSGGAGLNNFTLSILLGDVNPLFNVLPPIIFGCPSRLNGIEVVCQPQDIKTGDFDSDSRPDIAISFSTRATNTQQATSGFVNAYAGRGDGTFDFGTQIIVGLGPRRIVAADVTGDSVPDVVVTAYTDSTVQVLRAKTPPKKNLGESCVVGRQCLSGKCVDGVCCDSGSCPTGQFCDILPNPGTCQQPAPPGTPCTDLDGTQCSTHDCVNGFCCTTISCPLGQYCNTGMCAPPASNGTQCNADEQCSSNHCTDGVCCGDASCAVNAACNIPGSEGVCTTRLPPGQPCTDSRQCCTSTTDITACDPSFCENNFCCERQCTDSETCAFPGSEGRCVPAPAKTPTPTKTPLPTLTPTPAGLGARCSFGANCLSGNCVDGVCCESASCGANESCSMPASPGHCVQKGGNGVSCSGNQDCTSGYCNASKQCDTPPTATPTLSPTPVPPGGSCGTTAQCQGGYLCNTFEGGVCCNLQQCPDGQTCRSTQVGQAGFCHQQDPTPTPVPTKNMLGDVCTNASQCNTDAQGCIDGVCCDSNPCTRPNRCDIFNFKGYCVPPLMIDDSCEKPADCETSFCNPVTLLCAPPPSPTATAIQDVPPTPTPPFKVSVSRSGGCTIGDGQNGHDGLALLAVLPFAFWLRRRAQSVLVRSIPLIRNRRK
ncbi:MAG: VCBS repeat-containing protein [Deltaproteobacteria bacterium]|nr:VCBS repeat-containing protein [Deltaproteobacteria bacterium]